jgi:hypothetical protein
MLCFHCSKQHGFFQGKTEPTGTQHQRNELEGKKTLKRPECFLETLHHNLLGSGELSSVKCSEIITGMTACSPNSSL